jgi:hypothetical protein
MEIESSLLRVSVATLDRVIFPRPSDGTRMLALERKAATMEAAGRKVSVQAQPYGGAVRILDPAPLEEVVGELKYDSDHYREEMDFRILIPPSTWEAVKQFCLRRLSDPADVSIESLPQRELAEEFAETFGHHLKPDEYAFEPAGFTLENDPLPTDNPYAAGWPTVRLYRLFKVQILDRILCESMLSASRDHPDRWLEELAVQDLEDAGKGQAHGILTLPLKTVISSCLALKSNPINEPMIIEGHQLDRSVLAILPEVPSPFYQRIDD